MTDDRPISTESDRLALMVGAAGGSITEVKPRTMQTTITTYTLFLIFGAGSWVTVNGLFTELPLLVTQAPEGWHLASQLAIVVQIANIGPLGFYMLRRLARTPVAERRLMIGTTYAVLLVGAGAMVALAFLWWVVVDIAGRSISVCLLLLAFLAALADCTSSLLFWSFVGTFRSIHISALSAGEGMSGVFASFFVWVQDASSDEPRFSASVYFWLLAATMCFSLVAFHILHRSSVVAAEKCGADEGTGPRSTVSIASTSEDRVAPFADVSALATAPVSGCILPERPPINDSEIFGLLALQALLNALQNGVAVSCLALAAKPYGRSTYQVAQTASLFIDPLAAALGFFIHASSQALIPIGACVTAVHIYILVLSLDAVSPPMLSAGGGILLVILASFGRALTAYSKMRINVLLQRASAEAAAVYLMWSGIAMQCGAFFGTAVLFVLINFTSMFRSST